jgi:hypothetical protein
MKFAVTYTRVLTLEEEIEANSQEEAEKIAENRSEELLNNEYTDADCEWLVETLDEDRATEEDEEIDLAVEQHNRMEARQLGLIRDDEEEED